MSRTTAHLRPFVVKARAAQAGRVWHDHTNGLCDADSATHAEHHTSENPMYRRESKAYYDAFRHHQCPRWIMTTRPCTHEATESPVKRNEGCNIMIMRAINTGHPVTHEIPMYQRDRNTECTICDNHFGVDSDYHRRCEGDLDRVEFDRHATHPSHKIDKRLVRGGTRARVRDDARDWVAEFNTHGVLDDWDDPSSSREDSSRIW